MTQVRVAKHTAGQNCGTQSCVFVCVCVCHTKGKICGASAGGMGLEFTEIVKMFWIAEWFEVSGDVIGFSRVSRGWFFLARIISHEEPLQWWKSALEVNTLFSCNFLVMYLVCLGHMSILDLGLYKSGNNRHGCVYIGSKDTTPHIGQRCVNIQTLFW